MDRFSTITIREKNESIKVKIGSAKKPTLQKDVINKWQSLLDTTARLVKVPAGLIMLLNEKTIEVFIKSNTKGNPYEPGEKADLIYGLYCETVIGTQNKLLVPDATKCEIWSNNNPDIAIGMISYLGFPINWPDGEIFGTICILDNKENHYNNDYESLLYQVKQHVENDLKLIVLNEELQQQNAELKQLTNTKSRFLSLISHDIRGNIGTISEFLREINDDFDKHKNDDSLKLIISSLAQNASTTYNTLENLLSWSKADLVHLNPVFYKTDIIDVIERALDYLKQNLVIKKIKLSKSYYSSKAIIETDENMLSVIIRNIISNAIKYNKENGEIFIKVDKNNKHKITIRDTGIGMSKEFIDNIFQYKKNHITAIQDLGRAGIGLMLAKEFIDKLRAEVSVKSELSKGTSFIIRI